MQTLALKVSIKEQKVKQNITLKFSIIISKKAFHKNAGRLSKKINQIQHLLFRTCYFNFLVSKQYHSRVFCLHKSSKYCIFNSFVAVTYLILSFKLDMFIDVVLYKKPKINVFIIEFISVYQIFCKHIASTLHLLHAYLKCSQYISYQHLKFLSILLRFLVVFFLHDQQFLP